MTERARARTQSLKVLVVDDHEISLRSTVAALREFAGSVKQASTLPGALSLALEWLPDAVCTDLDLGGDSGLALIRALREQWPADLPQPNIVAISGELCPAVISALTEMGVHRMLVKPVEPGELRSALRSHSGRAAATESASSLDGLFERELQRRLPQLDHAISSFDLQGAAHILHQLVASSAICGCRVLEGRLRELYAACRSEAPTADLAAAYFGALRAVVDHGLAEREFRQ